MSPAGTGGLLGFVRQVAAHGDSTHGDRGRRGFESIHVERIPPLARDSYVARPDADRQSGPISGVLKLACLYHQSPRSTSMLRGREPSFSALVQNYSSGLSTGQELILIRLAIFSRRRVRRQCAARDDRCISAVDRDRTRSARSSIAIALLRVEAVAVRSVGGKRGASRLFPPLGANIIEPFSPRPRQLCPWRHRNSAHGDSHLYPPPARARLTTTQWLIVVLAAIGFAFDIYELLMAQFVLPPAIPELTGFKPGQPGVSGLGGPAVLHSGVCRRDFRLVRRLSDRPVGPAPGADLEHFAVCRVGLFGRLFHVDRHAAGAALHDVHRRLRRIRGRRGLAGRIVSRAAPPRERAGLYPGLFLVGRIARGRGQCARA